jgi:hypothetical protein
MMLVRLERPPVGSLDPAGEPVEVRGTLIEGFYAADNTYYERLTRAAQVEWYRLDREEAA